MKNKNILITVVVLALIVLGAGAYFTLGNKRGQGSKDGPSASQNQGPATESSPKTLKELLASSVSQKCTFTNTTEDASTTMDGVVYTSGGKICGDFTSKTQE